MIQSQPNQALFVFFPSGLCVEGALELLRFRRIHIFAHRVPTSSPPDYMHSFGFTPVAEDERQTRVNQVFDRVSARYDLMNDLMSVGIHRLWKREFVARLRPRPGERILDLAGGTGDIALRLRRHTQQITVCDINPSMLNEGRKRALDAGLITGIEWTCGNAESLPFPDQSFDAVTIAFGLRNVTHIDRALAEIRRVLKYGGRFFCLEFSHVALPGLDTLYDRWSFDVIPRLGGWITGDAASYQYLVESIRRFPAQLELVEMMRAARIALPRYSNLSGGIVAIHSGVRA